MDIEEIEEATENRRLSLRSALTPLNESELTNTEGTGTPQDMAISPEEFLIEHRGRRRKPITWSPVEYNKANLLGRTRPLYPKKMPRKSEMSSKLRRRLIMNPYEEPKSTILGDIIAMKLKALSAMDKSRNNLE